jgi:PKD repeat protein
MAVVADFNATPTSGVFPLTVQFYDLSTGGPTNFLWDFGDGEVSTDKNPQHTFTGILGDTFTVTLRAWIHSSSVIETTQWDKNGSRSFETDPGLEDPEPVAWAGLMATDWALGGNPDSATLRNIDINPVIYVEKKRYTTTDITLASGELIAAYIYETKLETDGGLISVQKGNVEFKINGGTVATISGVGDLGVWGPTYDLTSKIDIPFSWSLVPEETAFGDAITSVWQGVSIKPRIRRFNAGSADDISVEIKSEFVLLRVNTEDVVIDFVGTPLSGTSPLDVQFTDLSVVNHAFSIWDFGDGNYATFAGETHPSNTYTTDGCSLDLL